MLVSTAPSRAEVAASFIETARPPASSAGETILEPLESRLRLFCNISLEAARLFAATVAAKLELMTTDMVIFLDAKRGVRATVVFGGAAPNRAGRDVCLDGAAIVATGEILDAKCADLFSARARIFLKWRENNFTA